MRRASPSLLKALAGSTLVLWGGGQLVQNESSKAFLLTQFLFLGSAMALGKPVVCYAQGAGLVHGRVSRALAAWFLRRMPLLMVRDAPSSARLQDLGVPAPHVAADPAFALEPAAAAAAAHCLAGAGITGAFIAVALRRWGHYTGGWLPVRWTRFLPARRVRAMEALVQSTATAIDGLLAATGMQALFISMCPGGDQRDEEVAQAVMARMAHAGRARLLETRVTPALLKAILSRAELTLAMRSHAGILSAGAGTPVVAISYQGKGEALMTQLGLPQYAIPWDEADAEQLLGLLRSAYAHRLRLRAALGARVAELRQSALGAAAAVEKLAAGRKIESGRLAKKGRDTGHVERHC